MAKMCQKHFFSCFDFLFLENILKKEVKTWVMKIYFGLFFMKLSCFYNMGWEFS